MMTCFSIAGCGQMPLRKEREAKNVKPAAAADVQVALGRSFEEQGDFDKAIAAYREAARRDPKRVDAPLRVAILLDRAGRFAESSPYYAAALKASPGNAEIFCDRGYSLALQGKDAEAEAMLRQAIAKKPDLARAHNNLGVLLGRTKRAEESLAEFRKAGNPEHEAELNLAFALSLDQQWSDAKAHLVIAKSLDPKTFDPGQAGAEIRTLIARGETAAKADDGLVRTAGGFESEAIRK